MFLWILVLFLLFLYFTLDVNYYIRIGLTYITGRYVQGKAKDLLEPMEIYGIVLPSDTDLMLTHMNNSRYLREYDFGRFYFGARTRMIEYVLKRGGNFPVGATYIRYRLPTWTFTPYKVVTQLMHWDAKSIYVDQRLITLKDNIVRTAGYTRIACVKFSADEMFEKLYPGVQKPEMPADLKVWIEACELSSEMMKKAN